MCVCAFVPLCMLGVWVSATHTSLSTNCSNILFVKDTSH